MNNILEIPPYYAVQANQLSKSLSIAENNVQRGIKEKKNRIELTKLLVKYNKVKDTLSYVRKGYLSTLVYNVIELHSKPTRNPSSSDDEALRDGLTATLKCQLLEHIFKTTEPCSIFTGSCSCGSTLNLKHSSKGHCKTIDRHSSAVCSCYDLIYPQCSDCFIKDSSSSIVGDAMKRSKELGEYKISCSVSCQICGKPTCPFDYNILIPTTNESTFQPQQGQELLLFNDDNLDLSRLLDSTAVNMIVDQQQQMEITPHIDDYSNFNNVYNNPSIYVPPQDECNTHVPIGNQDLVTLDSSVGTAINTVMLRDIKELLGQLAYNINNAMVISEKRTSSQSEITVRGSNSGMVKQTQQRMCRRCRKKGHYEKTCKELL